jgi:hypothetical protein
MNKFSLVMSVFSLFCGISFAGFAQSSDLNIKQIVPSRLAPGAVAEVQGGPFFHLGGGVGSVVYINEEPAMTYFQSQSSLLFFVPIKGFCGEVNIVVKTISARHNKDQITFSNPIRTEVICAPDMIMRPVRPQISNVIPDYDIRGGDSLSLDGINIMPEWNRLFGYSSREHTHPYSEVIVKIEGEEYDGNATYGEVGRLDFQLPEDIPCGPVDIHVRTHFDLNNLAESNAYEIEVLENCIGKMIQRARAVFEIVDMEFPDIVQVGAHFSGAVFIKQENASLGNVEMEVYLNDELVSKVPLNNESKKQVRYPLEFTLPAPGLYVLEVRADKSSSAIEIEAVLVHKNSAPPPDPISLAPPIGAGKLADFDRDGNCRLGDDEFFRLVDSWIAGDISESLFFEATDAWIAQSDICVSAAASSSLQLKMTTRGMLFASDHGLGNISIFDANGSFVFRHNSESRRVLWELKDTRGAQIPNGIYFVKFGILSETRMFVVLR